MTDHAELVERLNERVESAHQLHAASIFVDTDLLDGLLAALQQESLRMVVKSLEWRDGYYAETPFGSYTFSENTGGKWQWTFHCYPYGEPDDAEWATADEAKAAAQADYEQRILSALAHPLHQPAPVADMNDDPEVGVEALTFGYTNWRGEYSERRVMPGYIWFGATEWHSEPQWLLHAHDLEKGSERDFALQDFSWKTGAAPAPEPQAPVPDVVTDAVANKPLKWERREGRSFIYYTAETSLGRVRISRVNKFGQAAFRVYYPDGKNITQSTVEEAKATAEAYICALTAANERSR